MLRNVPTGTSCFFGTMAVSTTSPDFRTNLTWLPLWLVSTNPTASSRRLISRKGSGLSRPNLNLNRAKLRGTRSSGRLEVKLQCFLQVVESLLFGLTLAGDIDFEALGDIPTSFAPDGRGEWSLHDNILSHFISGDVQSRFSEFLRKENSERGECENMRRSRVHDTFGD